MNEFTKYRHEFHGINGECLFLGTVLHSQGELEEPDKLIRHGGLHVDAVCNAGSRAAPSTGLRRC